APLSRAEHSLNRHIAAFVTRFWYGSGRKGGQALVIAALAISALLTFTALVINAGMYLAERRHLQNAADAAALAGGQRLVEEQASRSFRDSRVLSAVNTLAIENNVDVGGSRQLLATY